MFLFKIDFNKILSWISSLKLNKLLAIIERFSGETTVLQKSIWSCIAEAPVFLTQFPVKGETQLLSKVHVL